MCQDLNALEAPLIKKSKIAKSASLAAAFFLLGGVAFSYCQQAPTLKAMTHNSGLRKLEAPASIHRCPPLQCYLRATSWRLMG